MKTRQEMIYDFMVAINSNSDISKAWRDGRSIGLSKTYSEYAYTIAEKMADKYLESQP